MTPEQITALVSALITGLIAALPAVAAYFKTRNAITKVDDVAAQNTKQTLKLDALAVTTDATHVAVNGEKAQMKQDIKMLQDRVEGLIQRNADLSHEKAKEHGKKKK